jgi:hypothetical protein
VGAKALGALPAAGGRWMRGSEASERGGWSPSEEAEAGRGGRTTRRGSGVVGGEAAVLRLLTASRHSSPVGVC